MRKTATAAAIAMGAFAVATSQTVFAKATDYKGTIDVRPADGKVSQKIKGRVCEDVDRNSRCENAEPGIADVLVSDGLNVVRTNTDGIYELPRPSTEDEKCGVAVFVTKPAGYAVPVDENNVPQFYYIHKPEGSPANVRGEGFRFGGLEKTGPLPLQINFPLIHTGQKKRFKVVISGDTQPYSNTEVGYVRDTIGKEWATMEDLEAVIVEGDVMGDDLSLYPRFKEVLSVAKAPQYYVPGNHDLDFDAPSDDHSFDTFRREWGPEYYSFDIGDVHFIVLDDVRYPCTPEVDNQDGLHGENDQCDTPDTNPTYNGVITERQIAWIHNDLAHVSSDKLVVLNMHIPIYSFIDQNIARQMVDNVADLYLAVGCKRLSESNFGDCERPLLALSGHTHTNEQIRPGEVFEGWETTLSSGSNPVWEPGGPAPFPQIIAGAAAGSWWSGDFNANVVPESYQRLGAPRGYFVLEFDGNTYKDVFKATGQAAEKQMSVDLLTPEFVAGFDALAEWRDADPTADAKPPFNINDLPDTKVVTPDELSQTYLSANVWNGSKDSEVYAKFDDRDPIPMERTQLGEGENILETLDPFALKRQMQIARHAFASDSGQPRANGFELFRGDQRCAGEGGAPCTPRPDGNFFWTDQSYHIWQVALPHDLEAGIHVAKVTTRDIHGNRYEETVAFEVREERPPKFFQSELFEMTP